VSSGLSAQLGLAAETTYGTAVTVSRFYPMVSEAIIATRNRLESQGIIAGANVLRSEQWKPGTIAVEGEIGLELYEQQTALLFEHMLGAITSSTSGGIATHTATPASLLDKSLTVQVGRPDVLGTVYPYTYSGVKISEWELSAQVDEVVTLGLTVIGQSETTDTSLATATYQSDAARPFIFAEASAEIGGDAVDVRGITVRGSNGLTTDRWRLGDRTRLQPTGAELRAYDGTISMEFSTTAQYERYRDGDEFSVVLTITSSPSSSVTITMNARYDGITPTVEGRGLVVVESPFKCVGDGSDASAITAVITNTQTNP